VVRYVTQQNVYIVSLGCAKNLVDSEVMLGTLIASGYQIVLSPAEAQIAIINTCAFIDEAKKESVDTIIEIGREKKSGSLKQLIVSGCLPQRYREVLAELLPEVDIFIGTEEFHRITEILELNKNRRQPAFYLGQRRYLYDHTTPRINTSGPGSAYVKISEGCSNRCSFCIIPRIRGPFRSRSAESVVQEVTNLSQQGVREINLISQDNTLYGIDRKDDANLADLLRQLVRISGIEWVRPLYLNPQTLSGELISFMGEETTQCRYIDMPVQHCSARILAAMHRPYNRDFLCRLIDTLRKNIPGVTLRTTLMVGFPGESDADFEDLCAFVVDMEFEHLGVFAYSPEEGTKAARLSRQIPEDVKKDRRDHILGLQAVVSERKNRALEGTLQKVLVEQVEGNHAVGRCVGQAPEVDGKTMITAPIPLVPGCFYDTLIAQSSTYDLIGTIFSSSGIK